VDCCKVPSEATALAAEAVRVCRACNRRAKKVGLITVRALLKEGTADALTNAQYYFCGTPACEVVYFSNKAGQYFIKADVSVRVGLKEREDPIPICYCFGHTVASAREEIARTGRSSVLANITAEIKAGRCACEVKNPSGSCCLGKVSQVVKALMKERKKSGSSSARPSGRDESRCVPPRPPRLIVHSTAEDAEVRRESCQKSKK
jgi:hypothetical protein